MTSGKMENLDQQSARKLGEWTIRQVQSVASSSAQGTAAGQPQQVEQLGKHIYEAVRSISSNGTFNEANVPQGST